MKPLLLFIVPLFLVVLSAAAQETVLQGIVVNDADSSPVPFAQVLLPAGNGQTGTNEKGAFRLLLPNGVARQVKIRVKALGTDTTFVFRRPFPQTVVLRLNPKGFEIAPMTVRGLLAKEVVQEAIKRIPQNYALNGLLYYGFYREYRTPYSKKQVYIQQFSVWLFNIM